MPARREIICLITVVAAIALLAGCSAESWSWLSIFLDQPDTPPTPTRRVRRDLLREIDELKQKLEESQRTVAAAQEARASKGTRGAVLPVEKAKNWEQAADLLPKDRAGFVDWSQALKTGAIAPRAGPDPGASDQAVLDMDIELTSAAQKIYGVTFSHGAHTRWLTCANCHPAIFPLRQAKPTAVTMAKIKAGEYCGTCHGRVAFSADRDCSRCHTKNLPTAQWTPPPPRKPIEQAKNWDEAAKALPKSDGMVDWVKALAQEVIAPKPGIDPKAEDQPLLPVDVDLVPTAGGIFKVVFSHNSHTMWLACPNCHTGIFQMAKGADAITMDKINEGQYCGICHGKVAFASSACARCHPAMAGGK
jgi:c(7)-type cytochrome triheme protein